MTTVTKGEHLMWTKSTDVWNREEHPFLVQRQRGAEPWVHVNNLLTFEKAKEEYNSIAPTLEAGERLRIVRLSRYTGPRDYAIHSVIAYREGR